MPSIKISTAEEEMKKNSELKESDLNLLKEWHKKQPHLPPISDRELILFLHSNYYRLEPTKLTIDTYFTIRTHVPEFFSGRDPIGSKELRDIMNVACFVLLPGTTPEGYKLIYLKLIDTEPSRYVSLDATKLGLMAIELWLHITGINPGFILLLDLEGFQFGHITRLRPAITKKYLYYLQEGLPIRLKGLHFINAGLVMDTIFTLIRPSTKDELMNNICSHSNKESLMKKIPIDLLANEQGGKAGPLKDLWADQIKLIEEYSTWFMKGEERKVNEAVRPGKAKSATDLFGIEGSFKKLDID